MPGPWNERPKNRLDKYKYNAPYWWAVVATFATGVGLIYMALAEHFYPVILTGLVFIGLALWLIIKR